MTTATPPGITNEIRKLEQAREQAEGVVRSCSNHLTEAQKALDDMRVGRLLGDRSDGQLRQAQIAVGRASEEFEAASVTLGDHTSSLALLRERQAGFLREEWQRRVAAMRPRYNEAMKRAGKAARSLIAANVELCELWAQLERASVEKPDWPRPVLRWNVTLPGGHWSPTDAGKITLAASALELYANSMEREIR
jgi:hypothetical protein